MSNSYEWLVEDVERLKSFNGKADVVSAVHWRCNAHDNATPPNRTTLFGVHEIPYALNSGFIEFDALTQEQLVNWVKNLIVGGAQKIESELDQILFEQSTPIVLNGLPGKSRTFIAVPKDQE